MIMGAYAVASATPTKGQDMKITDRERQIVALVERGYTNKQVAAELKLSPLTIRGRLSLMYERFECHSRDDLVKAVVNRGLLF